MGLLRRLFKFFVKAPVHRPEPATTASEETLTTVYLQTEIEGHLRVIKDCTNLINSTTDPDTFFSRYDLLCDRIAALEPLESFFPPGAETPTMALERIQDEREDAVNDFIHRSYNKAANSETSLLSFFYSFKRWEWQLTFSNAALLENLFKQARLRDADCKKMLVDIRHLASERRTLAGYVDAGIERYIFHSLLDIDTCPICGALDGKSFLVSEAKPGINLPPMHKGCRCFTGPYEPVGSLQRFTRSAQTAPDKWGKVPASMTYQEWYAKYVEGNSEMETAEKQ